MSNPFHDLANTWWDENGPFKTLHDINPCRVAFMQEYVDFNDKSVLDLGCGGGILTEALAKLGAQLTGIDIEPDLIEVAKNHAQENHLKIDYHAMPVQAYQDKKFDVIVCMEMLEHVDSPDSIIQECKRLLKPNGILFLSTINRTLKAYFELILMGEYVLKLLPRQTHDYQKFIQPGEVEQYLRAHQLQLKYLKGMGYNPLTSKAYLKQAVDVNYLLMAQ
ncbi:MAG TPA: bifunctional 3-demethylubiquinol 3-O-methyltransferase/2-polyprenyl-6-hydroxyphenol methylase [Legionellales bacterium]|nr:bifunctional 3-demethylubiquinol 3-O-methyltransferase/2-polyprenyl-6-hydroxyphenol methylase [Legionellales bacterium]